MHRMRSRVIVAVTIYATGHMHQRIFGDSENSPLGMLMYHGGAALIDFALLIIAACVLSGNLSLDMQKLCFISIIANFLGWVAYLAYIPPNPYNIAIATIGFCQWVRLFWADGNADCNIRWLLFRGAYHRGPTLYSKAGEQ